MVVCILRRRMQWNGVMGMDEWNYRLYNVQGCESELVESLQE